MPRKPKFKHPLRTIRATIGLSQQEFGKLIDYSSQTVEKIENGRLNISRTIKARIFIKTGADTKELMKGRKGMALDQSGQPYSNEFYQNWKLQGESYNASVALKDLEMLLAEASSLEKLPELLFEAQTWCFEMRNCLQEIRSLPKPAEADSID